MDIVSALKAAKRDNAAILFPDMQMREDFTKRFDDGIGLPGAFAYRPARFVAMSIEGADGVHHYELNLINWCQGLITYTQVYYNVPVISYPFSGCYMIMFDVRGMHEAGGGVRLHKGRYVAHVHTDSWGPRDRKRLWDAFTDMGGIVPICGFRPDMPFWSRTGIICGLLVNPYSSPRLYSLLLQEEEFGRDGYRVADVVEMRSLTPALLGNIEVIPLDVEEAKDVIEALWRAGLPAGAAGLSRRGL